MDNVGRQTEPKEVQVRSHMGWLIGLAIGLIILGGLDIFLPFVSSYAMQNLAGILLVIGGIMYIVHTSQWRMSGRIVPGFFLGILYIIFGLTLLTSSVRPVFTFSFMLGIFFLIEGIFKIAQSIRIRPSSGWGWMLFSGIVSILLAVILWSARPLTAYLALGVFIGINLLISGLVVLLIALTVRATVRSGHRFCIGEECFQG